jgi:aldehyde:ferredoxin oxidoreductase
MNREDSILRINLSTGKILEEEISQDIKQKFIGGRGLGVKIMLDEVDPKVDPLSEHNKIVLAVGPLTGTSAPTAGRYEVISKSPLTGTISDGNSGGYFGPMFKALGYEAMVIEGKSKEPVCIWAHDREVELRDASRVWGSDTRVTTDKILEETDAKAKISCIGPAGERMVRLACIINDKHRAVGRGGLGAVCGSKNLKAIAVLGSEKPWIANKEKFMQVVKSCRMTLGKNPYTKDSLKIFGTSVLVSAMAKAGILPTRNFQRGYFEEVDGICGEKYLERIFFEPYTCFGCPISCGRLTQVEGEMGGGPEYETLWAFGPECEVSNLEAIAKANYLCNKLGLDTISTGSTIGCAMELAEKGCLNEKIEFGDSEKMVELVRETGLKEGFGNKIGEGSKLLAEKYRHPEVAIQVKGLELPAYDPRGVQGHALAYATSNRGGCHMRAYMIGPEVLKVPTGLDRFKAKGKAKIVKLLQDTSATVDSLILCRFTSLALTIEQYAGLLTAATGTEYSPEEFKKVGERIWTLERLFNNRAGFRRADDTLPKRFLEEPLKTGNSRGRIVKLEQMLEEYYEERTWTEKGEPKAELLKELEIQEYA